MNAVKRPVMVTLLSLTAFAWSPGLMALLTFFFFNIYTRDEVPSPIKDSLTFAWLGVWGTLLVIAFLILAWLALTAGIDLWQMKERGRHLALFSLPMLLLIGGMWWADGGPGLAVTGGVLCGFSAASFVYLLLPSTRKKFEARPKMAFDAQIRETASIVAAFLRRAVNKP